jgi:hypothetical protein
MQKLQTSAAKAQQQRDAKAREEARIVQKLWAMQQKCM